MITDDMIKSFCYIDGERESLKHPFNLGLFTYATNGHIAIRIDRRSEYDANLPYKDIEAIGFCDNVPEDKFLPMPSITEYVKEIECVKCKGTGEEADCEDCEGTGTVEWTSSSGIDYEADCRNCDGKRSKDEKCEHCEGTGKAKTSIPIDIGKKTVSGIILNDISILQNVKLAPDVVGDYKAIPFKFDGGIGLVMPMRKF